MNAKELIEGLKQRAAKILGTSPAAKQLNAATMARVEELIGLEDQYNALVGSPNAADEFYALKAQKTIAELKAEQPIKYPKNPRVYDLWIHKLESRGLSNREKVEALQKELVSLQAEKLKTIAGNPTPVNATAQPAPDVRAAVAPAGAVVSRAAATAPAPTPPPPPQKTVAVAPALPSRKTMEKVMQTCFPECRSNQVESLDDSRYWANLQKLAFQAHCVIPHEAAESQSDLEAAGIYRIDKSRIVGSLRVQKGWKQESIDKIFHEAAQPKSSKANFSHLKGRDRVVAAFNAQAAKIYGSTSKTK